MNAKTSEKWAFEDSNIVVLQLCDVNLNDQSLFDDVYCAVPILWIPWLKGDTSVR